MKIQLFLDVTPCGFVNISLGDWVAGKILTSLYVVMRIPVTVRSKAYPVAFLLGLRVRILPLAWMSVCLECCVMSVYVTGQSLV